jgi:hypothetical protein
MHKE